MIVICYSFILLLNLGIKERYPVVVITYEDNLNIEGARINSQI